MGYVLVEDGLVVKHLNKGGTEIRNKFKTAQKKGNICSFSLFTAHLTMLKAAHYIQRQIGCHELRRIVAVFSLRRPSVAQKAVCVTSLLHKVAVG
jgi:hypothetical protein